MTQSRPGATPSSTPGGFAASVWSAAKEQMRRELVAVAASEAQITYGELVSRVSAIPFQPDSALLWQMLGEISINSNAEKHVMLSAVVVKSDTRVPGDGFFDLAWRLGRRNADRDVLWVTELRSVYAAYRQSRPAATPTAAPVPRRFREETELHQLGYNVTDLNDFGRWQLLSSVAVPRLGLQRVAETIAGLVRVRRLQHFGAHDYQQAIGRWEHDLEQLKAEFFEEDFPWPSTEL